MSEINNETKEPKLSSKYGESKVYSFNEKKEFGIFVAVTALVCAALLLLFALFLVILPSIKYNSAVKLMQAGKYTEAIKEFTSLDGYGDSEAILLECKYKDALKRIENGEYAKAISTLSSLGDYKDSKDQLILAQEGNSLNIAYQNALDLMQDENYKDAATELEALGDYKDSKEKLKECRYNNALALMADEKYLEASSEFEALSGYKDSASKLKEINDGIHKEARYNNAIDFMKAKAYDDAISEFKKLGNYKQSSDHIVECNTAILDGKYEKAVALMSKDIIGAYKALTDLGGYKDSASKAASIYDDYQNLLSIKNSKVGSYITFGSYEQDNNTANGKEPIEWRVLKKSGNKTLVISRYALDCKPYNNTRCDVTWKTCTLRSWLNNTFFKTAFTTQEQSAIATTKVDNIKEDYYGQKKYYTNDKVFLLSDDEVFDEYLYSGSRSSLKCKPTKYAVARGVDTYDNDCYWWMRSPSAVYSEDGVYAAYVDSSVVLGGGMAGVAADCIAVRPAMWITVNA